MLKAILLGLITALLIVKLSVTVKLISSDYTSELTNVNVGTNVAILFFIYVLREYT